MTIEEKFNKFCKEINWSKENCNSEEIKITLMRKYSREELDELSKFGSELSDQLEEAVERYQLENMTELSVGSDDGFSDLRAQIVSEGTESAQKYLKNPKLMEKRYEDDDYIENFFYCFPYDFEYEMTTLEFYKNRVLKIKDELVKNDVKNVTIEEEIMLNTILDEMYEGVFDPNYSYDKLNQLSKRYGLGSGLANTWHDGLLFYIRFNSKSAS